MGKNACGRREVSGSGDIGVMYRHDRGDDPNIANFGLAPAVLGTCRLARLDDAEACSAGSDGSKICGGM